MEQIRPIATVKALIYKNKKVFMLMDKSGNWELPGGKIEFGETFQETLTREFKEELNLDKVCIGELINLWSFVSNSQKHFLVIVFQCKANLENIKISEEHQRFKWVDIDRINEFKMRDGYRESIEKFLKKYGKTSTLQ